MADFSYDLLPYASFPFEQTMPENLQAIARLFGLHSPDFRRCRVLELGCASGGNIIPLADLYPEASFTGVDISETELAEGRETIAALGLGNVRLESRSVTDIDGSLGEFDYIIAHGLYTWVDEEAQRQIMRICKENLSATGVAYISYNTYPGWNLVNTVRDMMRYHTRAYSDPATKTAQARAVLKFMIDGLEGNDSSHALLLRDEMQLLSDKEDYYLFHDHLANVNRPLYFHEFMERAHDVGLEYLGDTDLQTMLVDNLPAKVAETLKTAKDIVQAEQYMDFFRNRRFRHTLLCHRGNSLNRNIRTEVLDEFHLYSDIRSKQPLEGEIMNDGVLADFSAAGGKVNLGTPWRLSKLVFKVMAERRARPLTIADLTAAVHAEDPDLSEERVRSHILNEMNMVNLVFKGIIKLRLSPGPYRDEVEEKPRTTRLARYQAHKGVVITNARHQPLKMQQGEAVLIRYLDGEHDLGAIVDHLMEKAREGAINIQFHVPGAADEAGKREVLMSSCRDILQRFAKLALLV